jgi:hypothetical protein
MDRVEHICRDYLAVSLGGQTEVQSDGDRIDVAIPDANLLIEVKGPGLSPAGFKAVPGQLLSYAHEWERQHGQRPSLRLHWVVSDNRLTRKAQLSRIERHQHLLEGIQVTTEVMPPLPSEYEIAGRPFSTDRPVHELTMMYEKTRAQFMVCEHLSSWNQQFLTTLAQAIYPQCQRVTVESGGYGGGLVVYAMGGTGPQPVPIAAAIQAWLRQTHYRWWSVGVLSHGGLS